MRGSWSRPRTDERNGKRGAQFPGANLRRRRNCGTDATPSSKARRDEAVLRPRIACAGLRRCRLCPPYESFKNIASYMIKISHRRAMFPKTQSYCHEDDLPSGMQSDYVIRMRNLLRLWND